MQSTFPRVMLAVCLLSGAISEAMVLSRLATELRCQCIKTESNFISPEKILTVELFPSGAYCASVEVIATLKEELKVCLEPSAPWVEKIIKKILENSPVTTADEQ
ncbi:interleukin-8-like isoform X2 [Rhinatrema bivittatum]|uniref:interleukin-8-like isoform X2 n=1 Tax=Rhinatrema bivittatum TaxID=194408 RepID=UPI00112CF44E|nr:interleukin-8-like isoform X2 [Rhinatrema bivittatum]